MSHTTPGDADHLPEEPPDFMGAEEVHDTSVHSAGTPHPAQQQEEAPPHRRPPVFGPRGASEPEEDGSSTPLEQQEGNLFISGTGIDPLTGDRYWEASSTDSPRLIRFKLPFEKDDKDKFRNSKFVDGLQRNMDDITHCHLVRRAGGGENDWVLKDMAPSVMEKDRQVKDQKGTVWTWTDGLDRQVDQYFRYGALTEAMNLQKDKLHDPESIHEIINGNKLGGGLDDENVHPGARALFRELVQKYRQIDPKEVDQYFDTHLNPASPCSKHDYTALLAGEQLNEHGEVRRVFYDTARSPAEQIPGLRSGTKEVAMSGLLNFAFQDAANQAITSNLRAPCRDPKTPAAQPFPTLLQKLESDLIKEGRLENGHPLRDQGHYNMLAEEFGEVAAGRSMRTLMAAAGAVSATTQYDDVSVKPTSTTDPKTGQPWTYGATVLTRAMRKGGATPAANQTRHGDSLRNSLIATVESANELNCNYEAGLALKVDDEMSKAMAPGRLRRGVREPDKDHDKKVAAVTDFLKSSAKNVGEVVDKQFNSDIFPGA